MIDVSEESGVSGGRTRGQPAAENVVARGNGAPDLAAATALVRSAIASVDLAWVTADWTEAEFDVTFALGEASHSLHRALAALSDWNDRDTP